MERVISQQEFDRLMRLEGEIRGAAVKQVTAYLLKEQGKEGLQKLEEVIASLGYSFKYEDIKVLDFYPLGVEASLLLAAKRIFNYGDEDFQKMGEFAPKTSVLLVRMFMKYLVSIDSLAEQAPRIWRQHYSVGKLEAVEINKEQKYVITRIKDFHYVPMACHIYRGYFISALKMILKTDVSCKETKCIYKGDPYHEFLIEW